MNRIIMSSTRRQGLEHVFRFDSGATTSQTVDLEGGAFGTIIVPAGSVLIGKTAQFVGVSRHTPALFADTDLLSTPVTLLAGANALTADQIREAGAATRCRLKVNSAVGSDASCALLWKA